MGACCGGSGDLGVVDVNANKPRESKRMSSRPGETEQTLSVKSLKEDHNVSLAAMGVDFKALVDFLSQQKEKDDLSKLGLRNNKLGNLSESDWKSFVAALPSSITMLDLSTNSLGQNGARALASALGEAGNLRELHLHCNSLGQDAGAGLKELVPALGQLTALQILGLGENQLGASVVDLVPLLAKMVGLQELQLGGNMLRRDAIESLWNALPAQTKVNFGIRNELVAISEGLAKSGGAEIVQIVDKQLFEVVDWAGSLFHFGKLLQPLSIEVRQKVITLEIIQKFGNSAMECLVKDIVGHLPALSSLSFPSIVPAAGGGTSPPIKIKLKDMVDGTAEILDFEGVDGGAILLQTIRPKQISLKVLNLNRTGLGMEGTKCFAGMSGTMPDLSGIGLAGNNVGSEEGVVDAVALAIASFKKLQIIDLSDNLLGKLSEEKLKSLMSSMPKTVTKIHVNDNMLGHYDGAPFKVLGTVLKDQAGLQKLDLAGNELRGKCLEDGQGVGLLPSDYDEFFKVLPRSVINLDLSRNNYGMYEGAGARCVAPSLTQITGLQMLHLGSNYLEPAMETMIIQCLPEGCQLERDNEFDRKLTA